MGKIILLPKILLKKISLKKIVAKKFVEKKTAEKNFVVKKISSKKKKILQENRLKPISFKKPLKTIFFKAIKLEKFDEKKNFVRIKFIPLGKMICKINS